MAERKMVLELAGHEVAVSNPSKVYFPRAGVTKLDMVRYYLAVAPGALGGVRDRPMALKRFVNGAEAEGGVRTPRSSEYSRWNNQKDLSFVPLRPELVVEVRYDHMEGPRFRHTAQFVRWRPDRKPESCTFGQLEEPVGYDLADVLSAGR